MLSSGRGPDGPIPLVQGYRITLDVRGEQVVRAVRQVQDAHEPEDQRQARREQEQQHPEAEPVQQLERPESHLPFSRRSSYGAEAAMLGITPRPDSATRGP